MFEETTEEYESLEAGRRIKDAKDRKEAFRDLIDLVMNEDIYDPEKAFRKAQAILSDYPDMWKQKIVIETVFCKWTMGDYYLGISPDGKCPVCGHKGKYHDHAHKQSSCRICTAEHKEKKKDEQRRTG